MLDEKQVKQVFQGDPTIYAMGKTAFLENQGIDKCPFQMGHEDGRRNTWMQGWYSARTQQYLQKVRERLGLPLEID